MPRRRNSGVSLIELIIAVAVLVLGMIALMSAVISSSKLSDSSKESVIAYEAARSKIEEIRNYTKCGTYNNIFNYYKPGAKDALNVPTSWSTVSGLNPVTRNGVAQHTLEVFFPINTKPVPYLVPLNKTSIHLTEVVPAVDATMAPDPDLNYNSKKMGMPKDLNRSGVLTDTGDGTGSATDLDLNYKILPVLVRVQWESIGKRPAMVEVVTYITEK